MDILLPIKKCRLEPAYTTLVNKLQDIIMNGAFHCPYGIERQLLDDSIAKMVKYRCRLLKRLAGIVGGEY